MPGTSLERTTSTGKPAKPKTASWRNWQAEHIKHLARCSEDCILWRKTNNKIMPFWVVVEAWSFGLASRYYGLLKRRHQQSMRTSFAHLELRLQKPSTHLAGGSIHGALDQLASSHAKDLWNGCRDRQTDDNDRAELLLVPRVCDTA
jgi:hypothetical protein